MVKQYYVRTLSSDNCSCCFYVPKDLAQLGYTVGKHVKLTVNDDQTLTISKIKDGRDEQI